MAVATPADTSKTLAQLGLTVAAGCKRLILWASGAGVTVNYNGAATAGTIPVPTQPWTLDCQAADVSLLQFLGNGALTLNVVQMG
jgi:hypothetical protein